MAAVIPTETLVNMLADALNTAGPLNVRLFQNAAVGNPTMTLAGLTEATFSGYAPVLIVPAVSEPAEDPDTAATQEFDITFAHSGGAVSNTVYGYYVTGDSTIGQQLMWMESDRLAPIAMKGISDVYEVLMLILATQES